MFKSFLQGFFKPAPVESVRRIDVSEIPASPQHEPELSFTDRARNTIEVQTAIIESLTAHIAKIDGEITTVRVPHFAIEHDGARYRTASSDFEVVRGLDPYGANVLIERAAGASEHPDSVFAAILDAAAAGTHPREANATGNSISYSYGGISGSTVGEAK